MASHDLSEPLRMVSGFVSLLQSRYADRLDDDAGEFMRYIVDGVERMQALIRDLLSYSRVGAPSSSTSRRDRPARPARARGHADLDHETGATIVVGDLPTVPGDASQLVQLLQNLVANALKFTGDEPPGVRVTAARDRREWAFPWPTRASASSPSYGSASSRSSSACTRPSEYPAAGVGLAICRAIAERHGGRIWVESTPGEGSVFRFTLPA